MTSQLRRKHRTTVRSTSKTRVSEALVALLGLVMAASSAPAVAGDSPAGQPRVVPVNRATGLAGQKLKWLPYRPSTPSVVGEVVAAGRVSAAGEASGVRTARLSSDHPMSDPFGDTSAKTKATGLSRATTAGLLDPPPTAEVAPSGELPKLFKEQSGGALERQLAEDTKAEETEPGKGEAGVPTIEESLAAGPSEVEAECPSPRDKDYFTPIGDLTTDLSVKGDEGKAVKERMFPRECPLDENTFVTTFPRSGAEGCPWPSTVFTWKASGLCHKPLYFEDVHLERYGHSWGPYLQPIISGGHFFLNVPVLPYHMALYPPCECMYTLGYYRPGNCAPYLLDPLPLSVRAGLAEAGVWTGMVFLIP